jgi:hypothetical protein
MWKLKRRVKCKNCLHLNVCDGLYFNLDKECERDCGYFKEGSKYANVVRCEKCEKSESTHCSSGQVWCTKLRMYMKADGFCSCGEMRKSYKLKEGASE